MLSRHACCLLSAFTLCGSIALSGCNSGARASQVTTPPAAAAAASSLAVPTALTTYPLLGDTAPVRDPSLMHQGATYYLFSTDPVQPDAGGFLPIRCSSDRTTWAACGHVFATMPGWVHTAVPGAMQLWAPDISYFGGAYHLYYAASTLLSQVSAIGEATNATLDSTASNYQWVDHGEVLASTTGDDFNALDPTILTAGDGKVWLTYGSFWTGIYQRAVDPATGKLSTTNTAVTSVAARPAVSDHALEGASLLPHGAYYYLFLSTGHCCEANFLTDDYQQIVGRSSSPNGPFLDAAGVDLRTGGGTALLDRNANWVAPGGGSAYLDPVTGETLFAFQAAKISENGTAYLWVKQIAWENDWPVLN